MGVVVSYNGASAGLGNRLRVTLAGRDLARMRGDRFAYVWPTGPQFGPRFGDLFEDRVGVRIPRSVSRAGAMVTGYMGAQLSPSMGPVVQVRTGAEPFIDRVPTWRESLRALTPTRPIRETVAKHHSPLAGSPYVGVQIRAHQVSHQQTKDSSPVGWFIDQMHQLEADRPGVRFFVSCDVFDVKVDLLAEFPSAVAVPVNAPYNSTRAVQAAVADLYLLAGSSLILGPHFSSFVELAEHLAGGQVPSVKPSEGKVVPDGWWDAPTPADPLRPAIRSVSV